MEKIRNDYRLILLNFASKQLHIARNNFLKIILLTCIIFTSCDTTEPELIDYHNKILFTSSRSGKEQLYMMNPDGTDIKQITSGEYWHNNGRWSPDASKIVCNTEEGTTTAGFEMVVMNSDGSNRVLLGWGNQTSWYPDGSQIFYSYSPLEVKIYDNKLYSIDYNGENRRVISDKYTGYHTFSPDGKRIAFTIYDTLTTRIVILDFPGFSNPIYIGPSKKLGYPAWSPLNNEISFSHTDSTDVVDSIQLSNIYLMDINGNNIRNITYHSIKEHFFLPRWSPDGEMLIFRGVTLDGTEKSYLYMVNKNGTNLHKVINDDSVTSCDWSK